METKNESLPSQIKTISFFNKLEIPNFFHGKKTTYLKVSQDQTSSKETDVMSSPFLSILNYKETKTKDVSDKSFTSTNYKLKANKKFLNKSFERKFKSPISLSFAKVPSLILGTALTKEPKILKIKINRRSEISERKKEFKRDIKRYLLEKIKLNHESILLKNTISKVSEPKRGPGHFYTQFKIEKIPEQLQNFHSSSCRNILGEHINKSNPKVGPGSYDLDQGISFNMYKSIGHPSLGKSEKFLNSSVSMNDNPGPGEYNLRGNILKKPVSYMQCLGSGNVRFYNSMKPMQSPGPGEYLKLWEMGKKREITKPIFVKLKKSLKKSLSTGNILPVAEEAEIVPREKIIKETKFPFGSGCEKGRSMFQSKSKVGPGEYFPNIINEVKIKKVSYPFYSKNNKIARKNERQIFSLPETRNVSIMYRGDSYFDWNQKSYNLIYN